MANITILDINPTGADLFDDSESFLENLRTDELEQAMGGVGIELPIIDNGDYPLCPKFMPGGKLEDLRGCFLEL